MELWFSAVMPVYNAKAYLDRCVQSILSQNFESYEIILVDDGSTDGSGDLCDRLAQTHSCIRVVHKENGGSSSARNAGMEVARGQYIWFVDSDDWVEPGSFQCLYEATSEHRPEIVKFHYIRMEGEQSVPVKGDIKPGMYLEEETSVLLRQACCDTQKYELSVWSHIYSREILRKHGLHFTSERQIASEDFLINLQAYSMAKSICVIEQMLYRYEVRTGSLSQVFQRDLPEKYTKLYHCLQQYYAQAGVLSQYEGYISTFYLWHLLRGCCIPNAYRQVQGHTTAQGREDIRTFLSAASVKYAYKHCDKTNFSLKQRILLWAMKTRLEPVFYWLYVVKPKKG